MADTFTKESLQAEKEKMGIESQDENSSQENTADSGAAKSDSESSSASTNTDTSQNGNTDGAGISASLGKHEPENFTPTIAGIKSDSQFEKRGVERGLINEKTGSAVVVRENGQINLSSGHYAQYKLNPGGKSIEQTLESSTITNRRKLTTDEIVINEHKMNHQLWDFTDFKTIDLPVAESPVLVGNLCMSGSVLTKSWDHNLKRYVLIRRPWRGPVFSPLLNVPTIKSSMHVYDPLQVDDDILAKSDAGYHVNALITDANSLIGKEGVDRDGIDRNFIKVFGEGKDSATASSAMVGQLGGGDVEPAAVYGALKAFGYNDIACAGILGSIQQESSFKTNNPNPHSGANGLCQWLGSRWDGLAAFAAKQGTDVYDAGTQLNWMMDEINNQGYSSCSPSALNACASEQESATIFFRDFEKAPGQEGARYGYAKAFYQEMQSGQLVAQNSIKTK